MIIWYLRVTIFEYITSQCATVDTLIVFAIGLVVVELSVCCAQLFASITFLMAGSTVANFEKLPLQFTPHLNGKKLSTNSPWDFEYVFETMDNY